MDNAPGPISASVTAHTANIAQFQIWAGDERAIHTSAHPATTPATGVQKPAMSSRPERRSDHLRRPKSVTGCRHRAVQQSTADQQALDQQPGAWRTLRERGEKPLHMYPVFSLREGPRP